MRAVIQRVASAWVDIASQREATIDKGVVVLVGVEDNDEQQDGDWLAAKIANLRIFNDDQGVMNLSAIEVGAEMLVVSQFTLHASTKKGNRPSYIRAARPETAVSRYEYFVKALQASLGRPVSTGRFGADMQVGLVNDGPVTIIIDSKNKE